MVTRVAPWQVDKKVATVGANNLGARTEDRTVPTWLIGSLALTFGLVATAATSTFTTSVSIPGHATVQVAVGVFAYWLGTRSATIEASKLRRNLFIVLAIVLAYVASGVLSPVGDPFSFQLLSAIEILYTLSAFWFGRRRKTMLQIAEVPHVTDRNATGG